MRVKRHTRYIQRAVFHLYATRRINKSGKTIKIVIMKLSGASATAIIVVENFVT